MDITRYNALCADWHRDNRDMTLGAWLMLHHPEVSDEQIERRKDKSEAATMFFNRYVITSPNGAAKSLEVDQFKLFQQV